MKLMWFHLMPYTELPDDFRDANPSVWVDIHSSLFDPKRAHHMYNDFMDELEYAAEVGFDAICVNEHHSNGYGLMPSPNLIASSLARRTTDTAICVMGNSLALYNPPTRVAEEFAMIDCISGGRLIAGFPGRHADGHLLRLRHEPEPAAPALSRGARPGGARLDREGHLRLQRPLQPAALCEHLAASGAAAASADLGARRRLGRDLAVVRRDGLRLLLPVLLRLQGRPRHDGRVLGRNGSAGQGHAIRIRPASCNSSASAKAASTPSIFTPRRPSISTAAACMSIRNGPRRPATPAKAASAPASKARSSRRPMPTCAANPPANASPPSRARWMRSSTRATSSSARPTRWPSNCARSRCNLNVGHLMLLLQFGNMSKDLTRYNTQTVRRTGDAEAEGPARRLGRPLVAAADGRRRSAPTVPAYMPRLAAE